MDFSNLVAVCIDEHCEYPNSEFGFSPSENYPEYPFTDISPQKNYVYEKVRNVFLNLGLDKEHFATKEWNPLGEFIKPGNQVLLKPNWVMHENPREDPRGMECLVTHPSLIRAVIDYVIIALKGNGKIIVGDAPMYQCYFEELHNKMYNNLWNFFKNKHIEIKIVDFRNYVLSRSKELGLGRQVVKNDGIEVNLGSESALDELNPEQIKKYKIFGYPSLLMNSGHSKGKHIFLIHQHILESDVIINMPKPKTHRKAGMTACAKNFIGINCRKEYLPHHRTGAVTSDGDEYPTKNLFKCIHAKVHEFWAKFRKPGKLINFIDKATRGLELLFSIDKKYDGCWYGNDTIWRTISDLNKIVKYADSHGIVQKSKQRIVFSICDMIVCGEEEGPLRPTPKDVGAVVCGFETAFVDFFIANLMGFDYTKIKYIPYLLKHDELDINNLKIVYKLNSQISWKNYDFDKSLYFKPTSGWKGHIEKDV